MSMDNSWLNFPEETIELENAFDIIFSIILLLSRNFRINLFKDIF
jgi:hypothetical protein